MIDFNNKVVLITGASSGIGYELSKQLAKENCRLALLARRKNIIDELALKINDSGGTAVSIECDVSNKQDIESAIKKIKETLGEIDIAILNAAVGYRIDIENFNSKRIEEVFAVNVFGIIYFVEELLHDFINRGSGTIIGVSSLAEARGFAKSGAYSASKAAISIFLESLRVELRRYGIKVLTVKPGFVKTPINDKNDFYMPFLMDVEKAAQIILKGIKKEKKIIQFPLPTVLGSKLLKFLPNILFDIFAGRLYIKNKFSQK